MSSDAVLTTSEVSKQPGVEIDASTIEQRRVEKREKKKQRFAAEDRRQEEPQLDRPLFQSRPFLNLPHNDDDIPQDALRMKLMTWNMLAQGLVRRELFPGSDLLKWKDRAPVFEAEFLHYGPDIALLQEVDKVDHHATYWQKAGYAYRHETGYSTKLHGLCVVWRKSEFDHIGERIIRLDDAHVDAIFDSQEPRVACSRITRNIALIIALRHSGSDRGVIICTHHLFWHARHVYERARQCAILLHEIESFRKSDTHWSQWPCIFAGDFNIQPSEATYRFLTGCDPTSEQKIELERSTVVHRSVDDRRRKEAERAPSMDGVGQIGSADASRTGTVGKSGNEESDGTEVQYAQPDGDEDRVLKNTRAATSADALLSKTELEDLYKPWRNRLCSVYGRHAYKLVNENGNFFGQRGGTAVAESSSQKGIDLQSPSEDFIRQGHFEPAYTNITPLWRCTLDYIFLIPPNTPPRSYMVTKLLPPHRLEDMEPGLPRRWKEPSDHMPMMAELVL